MEEFNSEADDYNSDLPKNRYGEFVLTFSSNRGGGGKFQLQSFQAELGFNENTKTVFPQLYQPKAGVLKTIQKSMPSLSWLKKPMENTTFWDLLFMEEVY